MNNNPLASVIIPAYNTEKYIEEMLNCVIHQTYNNIEIIVIDDGSNDNTKSIVTNLKKQDNRIVLLESEQRGVSHARNMGLDYAKGEVIFFWDSDDIIELDYISKTINFKIENKVEAVLVGWANYLNGVKQKPETHDLKSFYRGKCIISELIPKFIGHSYNDINNWIINKQNLREGKESTACWRIMFDREIITRYQLRFDETLSLGEDTKFINEYFIYSTSIGFLDECLYYLRKRQDSANMTSLGNPYIMAQNKTKLIEARIYLDKLAEQIHGESIHSYWCGTLVFSVMELGIRLSHNIGSKSKNKEIFKKYLNNSEVKSCIKNFYPSIGFKAIPFIFLKLGMSGLLYNIFKLIPQSIISKFIK